MKTNVVKLSLRDYNKLRDFETNIKNNNSLEICCYSAMGISEEIYYSQDELVEKIAEDNETLVEKINELENQLKGKPKEIGLKDIKKMSIWQFIKWRKSTGGFVK